MPSSDNTFSNSNNVLSKEEQNLKIKIGRFAPSPTGALHFGSLIAAVASYLCARQHPKSLWLLRIEDLDKQREIKGATRTIINTLEAYGFNWDGEITYQSERIDFYESALKSIKKHTYPCSCSRKDLRASSADSQYSYIYPGNCRNSMLNSNIKNPSIRVITNNINMCFSDECQRQRYCQNINKDVGDFILKRRDGFFAYQLAVVVDDHLQKINHVVRGADLFDNTPRQLYLQRLLSYEQPDYLHFPVAITSNGKKLSKQNVSPEISLDKKRSLLVHALTFLGQSPPVASEFSSLDDLWSWSFKHWNPENIPSIKKCIYNPE